MDRFVVGRAVPHEVQLLHPERHILLTGAEIGSAVRERTVGGRNPECSQVPGLDEITPETQRQFSDDTPVDLPATASSSRSVSRLPKVRLALLVECGEVEPRRVSSASMSPGAKLAVERIACQDLDHRRELHHAGGCAHVPLVEFEGFGDTAAARVQVRTEALCCVERKQVEVRVGLDKTG
ncbi:hypothetical protein SCB71_07725 [Herbiconiux sp. KACC 21604]|uniref:hypothetical protein n=1 Tax=unclassified Herbiconiux TaxID=2618217 RepID=UPI001491AF50|nr:hypothetical protein [Herbiconiux sp. SALV-R1]QJU53168.1 hypothetical protein HL652_05690 [Herbiconiux sp. SALV-R1]WPO88115.1 hypothetical protein SCB71_07725 [Herbiconiux sp. KACC 21604]